MKCLFVGGPRDGQAHEVPLLVTTVRHPGKRGDAVYQAKSLTQRSTGQRWVIFVRGELPPADIVFDMIGLADVPSYDAQRAHQETLT